MLWKFFRMAKVRIAVATKGHKGLEDEVSEVFGRSKTFTIVDVEDGEIKGVNVVENPVADYPHGAGPIAVKMLTDSGVNVVIAPEIGPGVAKLLEYHSVSYVLVQPGSKVGDTVRKYLSKQLEAVG